jgi:hypothetical protein
MYAPETIDQVIFTVLAGLASTADSGEPITVPAVCEGFATKIY